VSVTQAASAVVAARFTPPLKSYAAYVFDCDGTLVESMVLHHRAWRVAFQRFGAPFDFDWTLFMRRAGMPLLETVLELNRELGTSLPPEQVVQEQRRAYAELLPGVLPIEPVVAFARALYGHAPLSVFSGGHEDVVRQSLAAIGILELFDHVVTAEHVQRGKPDPEGFLLCAERMRQAPANCLVIEDGDLGIEAAERAGMDWVRVGAPADGSGQL
jgi:HAD superfamily hydrolase (TIGR01509 family)